MTPFARAVTRELRAAQVPLETVSIVDHQHLGATMRALVHNALFYVEPTAALDRARAAALDAADHLAATIQAVGVRPQGISLEVDRARDDAIAAMDLLADAAATGEPTVVARCLGLDR